MENPQKWKVLCSQNLILAILMYYYLSFIQISRKLLNIFQYIYTYTKLLSFLQQTKQFQIVYHALVALSESFLSFFHGNLIEAAAAFHWMFVCFVIGNGNGIEARQFGSKDTHVVELLPAPCGPCSVFASRIKLIMAK